LRSPPGTLFTSTWSFAQVQSFDGKATRRGRGDQRTDRRRGARTRSCVASPARRAAGAKTVVVEIDTYGGLVTSALEMSRFIKRQNAEGIHTIAFVRDKANQRRRDARLRMR
jgi:ClpP class serine protease